MLPTGTRVRLFPEPATDSVISTGGCSVTWFELPTA
jgi:hypothetical protein